MDVTNDSGISRRSMIGRVAATFMAVSVLPGRPGFASASDGTSEASKGLWFEFSDGYCYRCDYKIDGDGVWINEHDDYYHLYAEYEFSEDGIWLTRPDGVCEYHWCVTDDEVDEALENVHSVKNV